MRKAAILAAVSVVCLTTGTARTPEVYAGKPCVRLVEKKVDEDTMTFTLANKCKEERSCTISWSAKCDDGEAKEEERQVDLASGAAESWTISMAHCGDAGYIISAPKWSCRTL